MINENYVEAILEWGEQGPADWVERWLADRGLRSLPMVSGLLVTGTASAFGAAFGVDLTHLHPPIRLEIPEELRAAVSSITIPPPRQITSNAVRTDW